MLKCLVSKIQTIFSSSVSSRTESQFNVPFPPYPLERSGQSSDGLENPIGMIAGNGTFPFYFAREAHRNGRSVVAVAHLGETFPELEAYVESTTWIKVGQLGRLIDAFKSAGVKQVAMAGGINRVKLFGGVKLDARGAALIYRLRSAQDDVIMRGIAQELEGEGIEVVPCVIYLGDCLAKEGVLTKLEPTLEERRDIDLGVAAIRSMSAQDIGQLVVLRDGVIVAVEAVEGSDATIRRGGELGGRGTVVVKCAKPTQDMRFDVPTIGERTIRTMAEAGSKVLAVESGRCLILDEGRVRDLAESKGIAVVGIPSLTTSVT